MENYTNEQLNEIKEAVYTISDGYQALKSLADNMAEKQQWKGQGNIAYMVSVIKEKLVGDQGCLNYWLKRL